ncbi:hypothetical protein D9757_010002 [Collybiopsis confluens]|uniref:F-box domain-containing protein n=1 Tax=Collybiopsis confluens TaxID=2823264 RepID=A0A8H5GUQ0_9AGAR|nr:hypothetical protein D9757_010002 [Collybiopsis confluens]
MQRCTQCGENILRPRVSLDFSSLNDRLRSQSGPLSVQPDEVTTILKNIELDEEDCEAEINRLETRALLLATQKERLREYANRVQALISPIRKLPDELLRKIFDLSCGMNHFVVDDIAPKNAFSFGSAPSMAISSVCSRWRKNALAMPMIWSRISFEWDAVGADSWEELREQLSLILSLDTFATTAPQCRTGYFGTAILTPRLCSSNHSQID